MASASSKASGSVARGSSAGPSSLARSCRQEVLGDGIGIQESKQVQQVGGSRMGLFDLLKGEREGRTDRGGMIRSQAATSLKKGDSLPLIALDVAAETACRFFDIRSCLIKGQGKPIEQLGKRFRSVLIRLAGGRKRSVWRNALGPAQQEERTLLWRHLLQIKTTGKWPHHLGASGQEYISCLGRRKPAEQAYIFNIVQDQ